MSDEQEARLADTLSRRAQGKRAANEATRDVLDMVRAGRVSKSRAARELGITRQTLDRWLGTWTRTNPGR